MRDLILPEEICLRHYNFQYTFAGMADIQITIYFGFFLLERNHYPKLVVV